ITIPTSIATARTLTVVRIGRWRILAKIILLTTRVLRLPSGREFHKLRVRRLLELEFLRRDGLVEGRLLNVDRELVVLDRPGQLNSGGILHALKVLVVGIMNVFDVGPPLAVDLQPRDFKIRAVKPDPALESQFIPRSGLEHRHHVKPAAADLLLLHEVLLLRRIDRWNQQGFFNMLWSQILQRVLRGSMERGLPHDELLLGGNIEAELLAIRDHVKNLGADDGCLALHSNQGRLLQENETLHIMVFLDYSGVH